MIRRGFTSTKYSVSMSEILGEGDNQPRRRRTRHTMEHVVHATALKAEAPLPEVTEAILHATVGRQGEQARVRRTATRTRERQIGVRQCQPGTKASKDARFGLPYS